MFVSEIYQRQESVANKVIFLYLFIFFLKNKLKFYFQNQDDLYYAKVQMVCYSPSNRCKTSISRQRTSKFHAKKATSGNSNGGFLVVDVNEQLVFLLRGGASTSSNKRVDDDNNSPKKSDEDKEQSSQKPEAIHCRIKISVYCQHV